MWSLKRDVFHSPNTMMNTTYCIFCIRVFLCTDYTNSVNFCIFNFLINICSLIRCDNTKFLKLNFNIPILKYKLYIQ